MERQGEEPKVKVARLRASKALWSKISMGKTPSSEGQMSKSIGYQMNNPTPMTPDEVKAALHKGLDVRQQYCVN